MAEETRETIGWCCKWHRKDVTVVDVVGPTGLLKRTIDGLSVEEFREKHAPLMTVTRNMVIAERKKAGLRIP